MTPEDRQKLERMLDDAFAFLTAQRDALVSGDATIQASVLAPMASDWPRATALMSQLAKLANDAYDELAANEGIESDKLIKRKAVAYRSGLDGLGSTG